MSTSTLDSEVIDKLNNLRAGDFLITNFPKVLAETPLEKALPLLDKNNAVLVTESGGELKGLLTKDDLYFHTVQLHLPTVIKILNRVPSAFVDKKELEEKLNKLKNLQVSDLMNPHPLFLFLEDRLEKVIDEFANHQDVEFIPVINQNKQVLGVISKNYLIQKLNLIVFQQVRDGLRKHHDINALHYKIKENFSKLMVDILGEFIFVKREREKAWLLILIIAFILGLLTTFLWIVNIW